MQAEQGSQLTGVIVEAAVVVLGLVLTFLAAYSDATNVLLWRF